MITVKIMMMMTVMMIMIIIIIIIKKNNKESIAYWATIRALSNFFINLAGFWSEDWIISSILSCSGQSGSVTGRFRSSTLSRRQESDLRRGAVFLLNFLLNAFCTYSWMLGVAPCSCRLTINSSAFNTGGGVELKCLYTRLSRMVR